MGRAECGMRRGEVTRGAGRARTRLDDALPVGQLVLQRVNGVVVRGDRLVAEAARLLREGSPRAERHADARGRVEVTAHVGPVQPAQFLAAEPAAAVGVSLRPVSRMVAHDAAEALGAVLLALRLQPERPGVPAR